MKKMLLSVLAAGLMLVMNGRAPAQEIKPLVVVSIASYDELIKDLEYAGQLGGVPELAKTVEGLLGFFTQGQGLAGLDKTKPWGGMIATDGVQFPKALFLPVTDAPKLLTSLGAFISEPQDKGDGLWEVEIKSHARTMYVKVQGGWAYIGESAEELALLPKDPTQAIGGLDKQYDIAVRAYVQNVPELFKQMGFGAITEGLNKGLQPQEGEDPEAFEARKKLAQQQLEAMVTMLNDLDQLTLGWSLDRVAKKTYIDVATTVVEGSKTAKQLAAIKGLKSNFKGFANPDAVFSLIATSKFEQADVEQASTQIDTVRQQILREIEKSTEFPSDEAKSAVADLVKDGFELMNGMLKSGQVDAGMSIVGSGPMTVVLGAHVGQQDSLPGLVDKVAGLIKREGQLADYKRDVAKAGDVSFHRIAIKAPEGEEGVQVAKIFGPGDIELIIGTGKDKLYLGLGAEALKNVQAALAKSAEQADTPAVPMQISLAVGPILKLASQAENANPMFALAASMLEQTGQDHIRITQQVQANGQSVRIEAEEGLLKLAAALAAQQRAAAGF